MTTLLIENGYVLTMDEQDTVYAPGWVWIEGSHIQGVGAGAPPDELAHRTGRVIDASHMAVLPGLINGHTHLSQSFMRGLGDDKSLIEWLKKVMWPLQAAMTPEDVHLASLLGLVENLRCGVTGLVQHHKITTSPAHVDATFEAAEIVGLRLRLARGWVDLGEAAEPAETIIAEMTRLYKSWQHRAQGRITVSFGPMVPWRCSDELMQRTAALAREWGVPTHIHVAEAADEIELMRRRNGLGHIEWLERLGVLGPDFQLVHCVHVAEREIDMIARRGATVVHCPVSNMYLASGAAPVSQMLARGIPVALGTDGSASHNSQDLLETLKIAVLLAKVSSGQATAILPPAALRMVTTAGARLLGRTDIGRLATEARADLTLVNLNNVRSMPVYQPASALVYNAVGPDVQTVIVDGRVLLERGQVTVVDEEALLAECRAAAQRLLKRAGVGN